MKLWEVDLVALAEICVAWEDNVPRRVIQQITSTYDVNACWVGSSSKVSVGSFCKPGGTGTLLMGQHTGRILDKGSDPWNMGRWSYLLLKGTTNDTSLLIITGYRTGSRSTPGGFKTAWAQQKAMLLKAHRQETPTGAFLTDITKWLHQYKQENMEIILAMDANEQWGNKSGIRYFAEEFQLLNIHQEMQLPESHPNIANLQRSTNIDYLLCSQKVAQHIKYAAATPYDREILGDHRGIIVDLDLQNLLGIEENRVSLQVRKLVLSNPKAVQNYLGAVDSKFTAQNIYKCTDKLFQRVKAGHTDIENIMLHYCDKDHNLS